MARNASEVCTMLIILGRLEVRSKFTLYRRVGGGGPFTCKKLTTYTTYNSEYGIQNTSETHVHKITNAPVFFWRLDLMVLMGKSNTQAFGRDEP